MFGLGDNVEMTRAKCAVLGDNLDMRRAKCAVLGYI